MSLQRNDYSRKSLHLYKSELDDFQKTHPRAAAVTQESVDSTRRMLQLTNECQDAGINTIVMLGEQGESLNRTEAAQDQIDYNLQEGDSTLKNIEFMEKVPCICLPCYLCYKGRKKKPSVSKNSPPKTLPVQNQNSHKRKVKGKVTSSTAGQGDFNSKLSSSDQTRQPLPSERYFQKITGAREEDEIEDNLTQVNSHVSNLKGLALEMGTTVGHQNAQLDRMTTRAEIQQSKVTDLTRRASRLVNDNSGSVVAPGTSSSLCPCSWPSCLS